jgi:ribonucleoside-triphosphate reductase
MNEAGLNARWLGKDMTHAETREFTKNVLNHMRERLSDYQEKYGDLYNLEATPAESTSYRLAKHDKKFYPDIITASDKNQGNTPYYTNSSHLPVGYTDDIFEALDIQDELQTLYTSGTVFHAFLGEKLPSWESAASLVRKIAENYKLPYYTLSPTYSVCRAHGYISGEKYVCPFCGEKTEVYSRITGYYRPVQNWNDGKSEEYKNRKLYNIAASVEKFDKKKSNTVAEEACACDTSATPDKLILFKTETCPNCKMAERFLGDAGIVYDTVYANKQPDLAKEYGIMQAPTLVVIKDGKTEKIVNVSNIRKFVDSVKA